MSNARDKANIPALNFSSTGIDDNATSTAITIHSNGKAVLGKTTVDGEISKLQLFGTSGGTGTGGQLGLQGSETTGAINTGGSIAFKGHNGSGNRNFGTLKCQKENSTVGSNLSYMSFATRDASGLGERMRIDSSGNVLIGTTDAGYPVFGDNLTLEGSTHSGITIRSGTSSQGNLYFSDATGTGTGTYAGAINYLHSVDAMTFLSNSGERMRIDSSGNVGIGTFSPLARLHVDTSNSGVTSLNGASDDFLIESSGGTGMTIASGTGDVGRIAFADSGNNLIGYVQYDHGNNAMSFQANGSERMRIGSSGNVVIGTTTTTNGQLRLHSGKDSTTDSNLLISNGAGSAVFASFTNFGVTSVFGSITKDGSGVAYNTTSDYRAKENVNYTFDATIRLKQLKPARFNFIADANTTVDGFLAHEVSSVVPEAITGEKDAVDEDGNPKYQGIDQSKLVPLLVKTIQELEARITALETNQP